MRSIKDLFRCESETTGEVANSASMGYVVSMDGTYDKEKMLFIGRARDIIRGFINTSNGIEVLRNISDRIYLTSAVYFNNGTNGYILLYGGMYNSSHIRKKLWLYNIDENTWTYIGDGPYNNFGHTAISYKKDNQDLMLIYGGRITNTGDTVKSIWEYNMTTMSWQELTASPIGVIYHTVTHYNDRANNLMIVHGGNDGSAATKGTWQYNIDTDTWTQLADAPRARYGHSAIYYNDGTNNLMVVYGGYNGAIYLNDTWQYNIDTDTWTQLADAPVTRAYHTTQYIKRDGVNLMCVYTGKNTSVYGDVWQYNLDTGEWSTLGRLFRTVYHYSSVTFQENNEPVILLLGGYGHYNEMYKHKPSQAEDINDAVVLLPKLKTV